MISDILSDASAEIDRYLSDLPEIYTGEAKIEILELQAHMDDVRIKLDSGEL